MDLKKIINKSVNLSVIKGSNKNPLLDKFRDSTVKRVNLKYKENKKEVVEETKQPERLTRIKKPHSNIIKNEKLVGAVHKKEIVADPKTVERIRKTRKPRGGIIENEVTKKGVDKKEIITKVQKPEKTTRTRKPSNKVVNPEFVKNIVKNEDSVEKVLKSNESITQPKVTSPQDQHTAVINKPTVKESIPKKEPTPEVVEARGNLAYLKQTFAKLLLPVKWSRVDIHTNLEE